MLADNLAYIVNELDNTITIHDLAGDELPIASYSVLPSDVAIPGGIGMCASAIHATPDFRFIYITNRLESNPKGDAIVWFRIAEDGRSLQQQGKLRTGLDHPRAAEIFDCQDSLYYIVGSKTERGAVVYKIDAGSGALEEVARNMDVLSPSGFVRI
jgi:6-phosphogluconolactonase (cycloisomerase 2 family)